MRKIALWVAATLVVAAPSAKANELERKIAQVLYELAPKRLASAPASFDEEQSFDVVYALGLLGAYDAALNVVKRNFKSEMSRSRKRTAPAFPYFVQFYRKIGLGRVDEARQLLPHFKGFERGFFEMNALQNLAAAEIARKNYAAARSDLFRYMALYKGRVEPLTVAVLFAKAGEMSAARRIFARFKNSIEARGAKSHPSSYNDLVRLAGKMYEAGLRRESLDLMKRVWHQRRNFYDREFLTYLFEEKNWDALKELAQQERNPEEKYDMYYAIAVSLLRDDNVAEAQKTAALAQASIGKLKVPAINPGYLSGGFTQYELFVSRFYALLKAVRDEEGAVKWRDKMLTKASKDTRKMVEIAALGKQIAILFGSSYEENPKQNQDSKILHSFWQQVRTFWNSNQKSDSSREIVLPIVADVGVAAARARERELAREIAQFLGETADKVFFPTSEDEQFQADSLALDDKYTRTKDHWLTVARIHRYLGDERESKRWISRIIDRKKPKNFGLYDHSLSVSLREAGFLSEAREVLPPGFWKAEDMEKWGWAEGEAAVKQEFSSDFLEWSARLPREKRLAALIPFAFAISPVRRAPEPMSFPFTGQF